MNSPLGTLLVNLCMGFHEKRWLDQFQFCDVLLYRQYADDIACLFNSEQDADEFFKFLNSQRSNIKFTFEKQKDDKLAFLDVLISKTDKNFCTSIYLKMTSIALYTNFLSLKVHSYKLRLIKTLIYRIYETNSSWTSFNEEVSNIKHLLMKNMYPSYLLINRSNTSYKINFPPMILMQLKRPD